MSLRNLNLHRSPLGSIPTRSRSAVYFAIQLSSQLSTALAVSICSHHTIPLRPPSTSLTVQAFYLPPPNVTKINYQVTYDVNLVISLSSSSHNSPPIKEGSPTTITSCEVRPKLPTVLLGERFFFLFTALL